MNTLILPGTKVRFQQWPDGPQVLGVVVDIFGKYSLVAVAQYAVPMLVRTDKLQTL